MPYYFKTALISTISIPGSFLYFKTASQVLDILFAGAFSSVFTADCIAFFFSIFFTVAPISLIFNSYPTKDKVFLIKTINKKNRLKQIIRVVQPTSITLPYVLQHHSRLDQG